MYDNKDIVDMEDGEIIVLRRERNSGQGAIYAYIPDDACHTQSRFVVVQRSKPLPVLALGSEITARDEAGIWTVLGLDGSHIWAKQGQKSRVFELHRTKLHGNSKVEISKGTRVRHRWLQCTGHVRLVDGNHVIVDYDMPGVTGSMCDTKERFEPIMAETGA